MDEINLQEDEEEEIMRQPFRFLIQRAVFMMRQHDEDDIERLMVDSAMQDSMDTYHEGLFKTDRKILPVLQSFTMNEPSTRCYVCLDNIDEGQNATKLSCEHIFHYDCLQDMVAHQHACCPLCRQDIPVMRLEKTPSPPPDD